jgi:hypothetical protein
MVVEQHQIALLPVVRVHELRADGWPLQVVHDPSDLGEIVDDRAIFEVDLPNGRWVHLERELAGHGVAPQHGQDLDLGGVDWGEGGLGQFCAVGVEA